MLNGFTAPNSNPSYMTLPVEFQLANPIPGESPPNFGSGLSGASTAGATFHIEYEYSPVPEGSIIGLVAGLGCLAALVRRGRDLAGKTDAGAPSCRSKRDALRKFRSGANLLSRRDMRK